jgi:four helix bundle protein
VSGITRFEDIDAWKAARELTSQIYAVTWEEPFAKDYGLKDQIQRAANSIMANVAEGFDGGSDREFIRFLGYARRSATEVQSHLYVALDQHYIDEREFLALYEKTGAVKSLISGFIRYLRTQPRS